MIAGFSRLKTIPNRDWNVIDIKFVFVYNYMALLYISYELINEIGGKIWSKKWKIKDG